MEIKVNALMIRAVDYGENDKILTLLTAERGKITAGIKGVKKAGAKLKFAAQPFCLAEYVLASRGERYTVIQASESESFYDLRCDIGRFYAASALCEAASALVFEEDASPEMFLYAVSGLRDMCAGNEGMALIKFLLRALRLSGYGFTVGSCSECGVSASTYAVLRAADGRPCGEVTADGIKRALRLLREYFAAKTDSRFLCLSEYLRLI